MLKSGSFVGPIVRQRTWSARAAFRVALMNEQLVQKIRTCPTLPSLPAIALQILELTACDQVDITEIARVISKDPALSSKILRTVNSSFYGRSQSISTISHALVILGLQSVKTLVLGFSLVNNLAKTKAKGFKHLTYWRRSVYQATAARVLATRMQLVQQEECFLAALLADLGMLVLDQVLGEAYGEIHEQAKTHQALAQSEMDALGMTHAEVSGVLAESWKLPPLLSMPMTHHHSPEKIADASLRRLTDLVMLAGRCADVFVEEGAAEPIAFVRKFCGEQYQMTEPDCDRMLDEICVKTKEVASLFEISISASTNFEAILKKANETLVELTLRTQQQAASLQQQNQQLQQQATTDGLTGLANRAKFDQFVSEQFGASRRQNRPMAILLIDVDHFKSVNDTHGHPVGDQVLRCIARMLRSAARAQDLAARYGGEEMCLVMPGTARGTASAIAESIRRAIAAKPIQHEALSIPVTVSIGVAALEEGVPFVQAAQLLKAADLAVYAAKHGGRNCVKVFAAPKAAPKAGAA